MVLEKKPMLLKNLGKSGSAGSYKGMRFYLCKEDDLMTAYVFPEPFAFRYTADDYKTRKTFEWSDAGYEQAIAWINEQYEARKEEWEHASKQSFLEAKSHI